MVSDRNVLAAARPLLDAAHDRVPYLFQTDTLCGQLLERMMGDAALRADVLRLIDVLPSLHSAAAVSRHIREYWGDRPPLQAGVGQRDHGDEAVRQGIMDLAHHFICARHAGVAAAERIRQQGCVVTLGHLGEATLSECEADAYHRHYAEMIDALAAAAAAWPANDLLDGNRFGPLPTGDVSIKFSALDSQLDPADPAGGIERLRPRAQALFLQARQRGVSLTVDLEQWELHEIAYGLFEDLLTQPGLRDWPHAGIVVQSYYHAAPELLQRVLALSRRRGVPLTVRLVKGAYWDTEVLRARQHGYPCPVVTEKAATDAAYERLTDVLLRHADLVHPAFAGHNLRSLSYVLAQASAQRLPRNAFEFQMLHGMAEPLRDSVRAAGYRVRVYAPVGDLLPGMAYVTRRLLENTAENSFLRQCYRERLGHELLLKAPSPGRDSAQAQLPSSPRHGFANCPAADFVSGDVRAAMARAVAEVVASLPLAVPVVVNGQPRFSGRTLTRVCPSEMGRGVATVTLAERDDVERAVAVAMAAWPDWRDSAVEARAALLERLAGRLQGDRYRLSALACLEVGKPWADADADVAEAVDYCRYYAMQARLELATREVGDIPGERNRHLFEGRGPTAVIAPWNFPLAIFGGMAVAALVAGNPVLLKPAEQASALGHAFYEHLIAAGCPAGVAQILPGVGEEVGRHLVEHPLVAQIAFTGSSAVGLRIIEAAGRTAPRQPQVKRAVCEMGGKNAAVVDEDADLDAAVLGVMRSAFGYAGQKCSACSRVLVVGDAYDPFVARLVEACRSLLSAPAHSPGCRLGPVVDQGAYERLCAVTRDPGPGAEVRFSGVAPAGGFYVPATVVAVHDPAHRLMQEELFGPILAVMRVDTFDAGLSAALSTCFALTGCVYSRLPSHLDEAARCFRVGNLYLNRACTGAYVHRQPFGGFGMSGSGTKAGGPGYLLNFSQARVITECTTRRGFTPDLRPDAASGTSPLPPP